MTLSLNDAITTLCIVVVVVTLAAFTAIHYAKYNPANVQWNRMNLLAIFIIPFSLCCIIPQYFLFDRTDAECALLHHWAGSLYYITNGLVKVFFLARSNLIAEADSRFGKLLMASCLMNIVSAFVLFNLTAGTAVINNICVVILNPLFAINFIFIVPIMLDLAINIRFIYYLNITIRVTSTANSDATVPRRLLKVTCMLSFSAMCVSLMVIFCIFGIIALRDDSLLTPIISFELTYNACAIAWPTII
ncbi:hypothetical protein BVRB_022260 [Beta vulgaris subsp. vulgaris]|uniref:Uncharacterized protein n=1 Tax=Beta vulgaris subsp. vulgaris TaxID=3555 RepID=A0A0J8B3B6_BETVV|nr:hypothetical protein BVRB_022260 [Beta vulgaris subsp. vulgaris]